MEEKIRQIQEEYSDKIKNASSLKELDKLFLALFGKNGAIDSLSKEFPSLPASEKHTIGPLFNKVKQELEKAIASKREAVREESYQKLESEEFTLQPSRLQARKGHLHLATQFKQEIITLFEKLGFSQFDAPHIELDKYNFEYLNIPADHPSRDMWDTLWVEPGKLLLRTHTSNFWSRIMEKGKTPIRAMSFDRCFRYEAVDVRHSHTFNQFEIAVVGKMGEEITMANLRYLSDYLLKGLLGKEAKSRFRPKYYPFVEPGVGIDCLCVFCHGKGCKICSGTGWFEVAGSGMIHPNVFKATGLDPKKYTGLAWGFGPDRMLMLKHGIEDIRFFLEGDLDFLQKY
ncbi:MAG: Phenylalanyl-tRNA synthetase alpha chain (Phenylalanine-tRNA ligase alpha chain) [Microgenomates group bacterium Gr01-1014_7]|nr:MAG: Phenylalanyl-tRNA synthetase alpha chain (Phenylalanine-tRNA ligase alpha chain) [Microgenomates group bacterium Gr01-1014_7]